MRVLTSWKLKKLRLEQAAVTDIQVKTISRELAELTYLDLRTWCSCLREVQAHRSGRRAHRQGTDLTYLVEPMYTPNELRRQYHWRLRCNVGGCWATTPNLPGHT
jgi:hypothetical protein